MKIHLQHIVLTLLLSLGTLLIKAADTVRLYLQTDKEMYVSGDNIAFKCTVIGKNLTSVPILFVDICGENSNIKSQILYPSNQHWEGYLQIPDTLETGVYLFRTYIGNENGQVTVQTKLLPVFNRFGNNENNENKKISNRYKNFEFPAYKPVSSLDFQVATNKKSYGANAPIQLSLTSKNKYHGISGISLLVSKNINLTANHGSQGNSVDFDVYNPNEQVKIYNQLFIRGKAIDSQTQQPVTNTTLLLSSPDSIPQINYTYSDSLGEFKFLLERLFGVHDLIIQTMDKSRKIDIEVYPIMLPPPTIIPYYIDDDWQKSDEVKLATDRATLYKAYTKQQEEKHKNESKDKIPFYGITERRVIPARFVELIDFNEIAWEILPFVKYKIDKDETSLYIWSPVYKEYYNNPFVLVDGIPVFNNADINVLNSEKISWIDIQPQIRCYGDLLLNSVLSIQTHNADFSDIQLPRNAVRFTSNLFSEQYTPESQPFFKDVLLWQPYIDSSSNSTIEIKASYEKGTYNVIAEYIDTTGKVIQSSTQIEIE